MAIRKRKWGDGKEGFEASVSFHGDKKRKLCKTKVEAKAWVLEEQNKMKAGTYLAETVKVTIASQLPEYEKHLKARSAAREISEDTARSYLADFKNYVIGLPFIKNGRPVTFPYGIGNYKISEVTEHTVEEFVRNLLAFGLSKKTVREHKLCLSNFFQFARFKRFVTHNPTKGIAVKSLKAKGKKKIRVPPKRLISMMLTLADEPFATFIRVAMLAGVRQGEQRALTWGDVDVVRYRIHVTKNLGKRGVVKKPKTEAGVRSIPISSALAEMLKAARQSAKFQNASDPIFTNDQGRARWACLPSCSVGPSSMRMRLRHGLKASPYRRNPDGMTFVTFARQSGSSLE
ncbi:MAG TPA: tyrosine-type recombinase/integrase [Rhizomicrobium sp.]|jgi:integrase